MDFELNDDQVALRDGVRSFCSGRLPLSEVRELREPAGLDRARWAELAEMGVFGLRLPEPEGIGLGWADAVLVFEELGRALVPGPLVGTHLAAGLVPGAADGSAIVGCLERADTGGLLEFGGGIDSLLVLDDDGVWSVAASELPLGPPLEPLDPLTPVVRLTGPLPAGERVGDADDARWLRLGGAALVAGLQLGIAGAACELAVAYAKERVQFDRPIGSFQALKHLMADMLVRVEVARGAAYAAGVTLDDPEVGSLERAVASAAVTASEAAVGNTKTCVQVHGGMGFTWEVDAHLLFKRAYALEPQFDPRDVWAERMADLLSA